MFIHTYRNKIPRKTVYLRWIESGFAFCTPHFDIAVRFKYQAL